MTDPMRSNSGPRIAQSSWVSVHGLFLERVRSRPDAIAVQHGDNTLTYAELALRARRLAGVFRSHGLRPGDRVAILSENRSEYIEAELAAAMTGTILACQNWRLARDELNHCLALADPLLVLVSPNCHDGFAKACPGTLLCLTFGPEYEAALAETEPARPIDDLDPESGLLILFTSGTTGLPKGALISHRAEVARMSAFHQDTGVRPGDAFVAWAPMFHMASSDQLLATLMSGGTVIVLDGPDVGAIVDAVEHQRLGWLVMMPGPIAALVAELRTRALLDTDIACVGAMADLVPRQEITELSALLNAPYVNSFGSTETGLPPGTNAMIPPGSTDFTLDKRISMLCQIRLLDVDGHEVPDGDPGEMAVRGPTLFSGYWAAEETNAKDFAGGWFRMGDLFRRNADGSVSFVDRVKYMIKSGGENIYPAEIERVLLADPRIQEAAVIKRPDPKWGEVPVAIIAASKSLTLADITALCRNVLAGYKTPKALRQIPLGDFPRSTSGKVQRHLLETMFETPTPW